MTSTEFESLEKEVKEKTEELNRLKNKTLYEARDAYRAAYFKAEEAFTELQKTSTALTREKAKLSTYARVDLGLDIAPGVNLDSLFRTFRPMLNS